MRTVTTTNNNVRSGQSPRPANERSCSCSAPRRWVSIDVGTKNLAYCTLDVFGAGEAVVIRIRDWNVVSLMDASNKAEAVDEGEGNGEDKGRGSGKRKPKRGPLKPSLIEIGVCLKRRFDGLGMNRAGIDGVIIENQIAPIASNMKSLQCMIMQYFVMNSVEDVHFIPATAKLKHAMEASRSLVCETSDVGAGSKKPKPGYKERKKIGVDLCRRALKLLEEDEAHWSVFFEKHRKKDDLADAYIQGLAFFNVDLPLPKNNILAV